MASPALVAATCVMGLLALLAVFARGKLVKRTHEGLAALRYVATFESDVFVRCNDALAKHFLSGGTKSLLSWFVPRYYLKYVYGRKLPGAYEQVVARTRLLDQELPKLLQKNHSLGQAIHMEQLVILGAGFDTRACRFTKLLLDLDVTVFEVDLPSVQDEKLSVLKQVYRYDEIPTNIKFVAADLNVAEGQGTKLLASLKKQGYKADKQTVFVMEGVTPFITPEAMDATMRFVTQHAAPGSMLLMDFVRANAVAQPKLFRGAVESLSYIEALGERFEKFALWIKPKGKRGKSSKKRSDKKEEASDKNATSKGKAAAAKEKEKEEEKKKKAEPKTPGEEAASKCLEFQEFMTKHGFALIEHYPPRRMQLYARQGNGQSVGKVTGYLDLAILQTVDTKNKKKEAAK